MAMIWLMSIVCWVCCATGSAASSVGGWTTVVSSLMAVMSINVRVHGTPLAMAFSPLRTNRRSGGCGVRKVREPLRPDGGDNAYRGDRISASRLELGGGGGEGDLQLFGGHIDGDVGEEGGGEVALAGVGQHAEDGGPLGGFGGYAEGSGEGGSGADADEDAFLGGEFAAPAHGFCVFDAENLVDAVGVDGVLGELGD